MVEYLVYGVVLCLLWRRNIGGLANCSKNLDFVHISCLGADQYIANYVLRYGGID